MSLNPEGGEDNKSNARLHEEPPLQRVSTLKMGRKGSVPADVMEGGDECTLGIRCELQKAFHQGSPGWFSRSV